MNNIIINKYIMELKFFINKKAYIIPVILVAIFSYGFVITHYSINIDTLSANRYFEDGVLIGQGRLTATIIHKIFNVMEFNPFFVDGIAVFLLVISAICLCALFKQITNNSLVLMSYTMFSYLFLSYPIINEIFVYTPASLSVALGFLLISFSFIFIYECIGTPKLSYIVYTTLLVFFSTSLYESFFPVYLVGMFIILILNFLTKNEKITFKMFIQKFCILLIPALIALLLSLLIPKIAIIALNIEINNHAEKTIHYKSLGIIGGLKNLFTTMIEDYFINGLFYLPIGVFVISNIISIISGIVLSVKKKNYIFLILFLGLNVSAISLSILQGKATAYRTCQTFQIFCAFAIMILYQLIITSNINKTLKVVTTLAVCLLIFYQVKNLHTIFYLNYVRYEEEKNTLIKICNEIEMKYGTDKPVVFFGNYELSNYITEQIYVKKDDSRMKLARNFLSLLNIDSDTYNKDYKYIQTNVNSYLMWSQFAFGEVNTELFKWIDILGYKLKPGSVENLSEAYNYVKSLRQPNNNEIQIIERPEYIIVNL